MDKFGVQLNLEHVRDARKKWAEAQTSFMADVEFVMGRLILEAANNRMGEQQVAKFSGMTVKRIRILMKAAGLDYRRPALMRQAAAEALQENAALLGIEPHEMDLMSPLAYLPAGSELRRLVEQEPEKPDEDAQALCPNGHGSFTILPLANFCPVCGVDLYA